MKNHIRNILLIEGRIDDVKKKYPDIEEEFIEYASQKDPSGNNKYLDYYFTHIRGRDYMKDWIDMEDYSPGMIRKIDGMTEILTDFHKSIDRMKGDRMYKIIRDIKGTDWLFRNFEIDEGREARGEGMAIKNPTDIYTYESVYDLRRYLKRLKRDYPTKKEIKAQTVKLYEDNNLLIIVPKTKTSSCQYGSGTRWCTAATGSQNYFESHTAGDQGLVYFIFKNTNYLHRGHPQKLALHWKLRGSNTMEHRWFNANDDRVYGGEFLSDYLTFCYSTNLHDNNMRIYDRMTNKKRTDYQESNVGEINRATREANKVMDKVGRIVKDYIATPEGRSIGKKLLDLLSGNRDVKTMYNSANIHH